MDTTIRSEPINHLGYVHSDCVHPSLACSCVQLVPPPSLSSLSARARWLRRRGLSQAIRLPLRLMPAAALPLLSPPPIAWSLPQLSALCTVS